MIFECLDHGTEVIVVQCHYLLIPFVHLSQCLGRRDFHIEYAAQLHRKLVCRFEYRIVLEQDVGTVTLYVSPFVLCHHQGVLAAGEYLAHGLAVGVCNRRFLSVTAVVFGYKLPADVNTYLVNGFVVHLLHMESVIDYMGVVEYLGGYQHHRWRQVAGHFLDFASQ